VIEETTQDGVLCGKEAPVFECDFGRVACAICFDLNFDELRLKIAKARPDLILFCSMYHGGLDARPTGPTRAGRISWGPSPARLARSFLRWERSSPRTTNYFNFVHDRDQPGLRGLPPGLPTGRGWMT